MGQKIKMKYLQDWQPVMVGQEHRNANLLDSRCVADYDDNRRNSCRLNDISEKSFGQESRSNRFSRILDM